MEKLTSILAVVDPTGEPLQVIDKAASLARHFGAKVELFLCDSAHAYELQRSYDSSGVARAQEFYLAEGHRYLEALRHSASADDVIACADVACESPLFEGILRKIERSRPDIVIKAALGEHPMRRFAFGVNDWQLARTCPVPLMLTRGRRWSAHPRFAAAVDVSEQETAGLALEILQTSEYLSLGNRATLDVLFSDRHADDAKGRNSRAAYLRQLASEFHVPAGRVQLLDGEPEQTLPEFARAMRYDVLVLGALTHRTGITALMGNLTSKLVDALECDFVLIKPTGYRAPHVGSPALRTASLA